MKLPRGKKLSAELQPYKDKKRYVQQKLTKLWSKVCNYAFPPCKVTKEPDNENDEDAPRNTEMGHTSNRSKRDAASSSASSSSSTDWEPHYDGEEGEMNTEVESTWTSSTRTSAAPSEAQSDAEDTEEAIHLRAQMRRNKVINRRNGNTDLEIFDDDNINQTVEEANDEDEREVYREDWMDMNNSLTRLQETMVLLKEAIVDLRSRAIEVRTGFDENTVDNTILLDGDALAMTYQIFQDLHDGFTDDGSLVSESESAKQV